MGLILTFVLVFLVLCCGDVTPPNHSSHRPSSRGFFEESDSVFDPHGNEHLVDDDIFCDDCDDYHDDWC